MGRIMLATSASTDEEYGGTFATEATDVAYDNTTSGLTADDVQEAIDEVDDKIDEMNLVSLTRKTQMVTTGATGNIALSYSNDGLTFIVAPHTSGSDVYLRAWVSSMNNLWYLTAVNPNTGQTVNNTEIAIRYIVMKTKRSV